MNLYAHLEHMSVPDSLKPWLASLPKQLSEQLNASHGDLPKWLDAITNLPNIPLSSINLTSAAISIKSSQVINPSTAGLLKSQLMKLHPWRKGPFELFDIELDAEWRSDKKWDRIKEHLAPLSNRSVLDIGCNNGYHCWRMLGEGAGCVLGIDPSLLYVMQFHALQHFIQNPQISVLPIGIEQLPNKLRAFDSVFSMGVLYHRRSPIDHLLDLHQCLRPGGQLILETLVIDGDNSEVLLPEGRYAKMRNVWFIPSVSSLLTWLKRASFKKCRLIDVTQTPITEQRTTEWMQFHSLQNFLDPNNEHLTVEGHPAPKRAVIIAEASK